MVWRAGLIGAGRVSHAHLNSIRQIDNVELAAAYDPDYRRAHDAAARFGGVACRDVDKLLKTDLDLVIICAPTFAHREYVLKAASAGKHILCEKPIALTLAEADEMVAAAETAGVKFVVGHVLRFFPEYVKLHEFIKTETYGRLLQLRSERLSGLASQSWGGWLLREDQSLGAIDIHIHELDFLRWTLGKPKAVVSMGAPALGENILHISTLLDYGQGLHASLEGSFMLPESYGFRFYTRALFEHAVVELSFQGARYDAPSRVSFMHLGPGGISEIAVAASDPYQNQLQYLLACIRDDRKPELAAGEEARQTLALALDIRRSMKTGKPISDLL